MDNSLRLITAWLRCCNISEIPAPRGAYPTTLTVVAGDLLFSLMKELTFSYLRSPPGLSGGDGWGGASKSEICPKVPPPPSNQTFKNTPLRLSLSL